MHIDHYGGLSVLQRHFPDARAIATPKSVELMPKTPEELAVYRKTDFGRLKESTTSDHELYDAMTELYPDWASNQTWLMFGLG
jgi:glyoxylase-like metal-dependent hydrolase (beta-lactamase superfamily II)